MQISSQKIYLSLADLFEKRDFGNGHLVREELDLGKGRNTNQFAYRGQFSPDFVANLLKHYASESSVIFDPFVGSGTVLFEAVKKGMTAFGTEINPAAYEMAKTITFAKLNGYQRENEIRLAFEVVKKIDDGLVNNDLYDAVDVEIKLVDNPYTANILKNAYISLLSTKRPHTKDIFLAFISKQAKIIMDLPVSKTNAEVYHCDARTVPLSNQEVDLIITSPPYINVFNYHQHNRAFIDRIYGNTLVVAKSEFGANRKHRQNRFLTVTQYIMDMLQTFEEMKRVLKTDGKIIFVVGRSSKVRGVSFRNDHIIAGIAMIAGYELIGKQERKFINKFGETIYESILHFEQSNKPHHTSSMELSRIFAQEILENAINGTEKEVRQDIKEAIQKIQAVSPSPIY